METTVTGTLSISAVRGSVKSGEKQGEGSRDWQTAFSKSLFNKVEKQLLLISDQKSKEKRKEEEEDSSPGSSQAEQRVPGTGGAEDMPSTGIMQSCWK